MGLRPASSRRAACSLAFAALGFVLQVSNLQAALRTVVTTGDAAPGTAETFGFFESAPVLNAGGEVAFLGSLDDLDGTMGIWSEGTGIGSLRKVALMGEAAPDAGGATFEFFTGVPQLNGRDVAFQATLDDNREGIFTDREQPTNALTKVALEGEPAPGAASGGNFQFLTLRTFGQMHSGTAFRAGVSGQPNTPAIYSEGFNVVLSLIAEQGDDAPGSVKSLGGIGQFTDLSPPVINDAGHVAFFGSTNTGTGLGAMGSGGIWATSPAGTLRDVALQGQAAPGTSTTFSQLFGPLPVINASGDIAFSSTLVGNINGGLRDGIWVERDGVIEKVVFESETAPGTPNTFEEIQPVALIDAAGRASFLGMLDDLRDGLWRETSAGVLQQVAIEGQAAPGTSLNFEQISSYAMNGSGQVAFRAGLSDFSTDGIFATDVFGALHKMVAIGDTLDLDGDPLLIESVEFLGSSGLADAHGLASGLNNAGQVAFLASGENQNTFEIVDGIFVMNIPTPLGLPGDFNNDGTVNAADYTLWRDNLGAADESSINGQGDGMNGVDQADYNLWRTNFGAGVAGTGTTLLTSMSVGSPVRPAVPEPGSATILLFLSAVAWTEARGRPLSGRLLIRLQGAIQ